MIRREFFYQFPAPNELADSKKLSVRQSPANPKKMLLWIESTNYRGNVCHSFADLTPARARQIGMALISIADRIEHGEGATHGNP